MSDRETVLGRLNDVHTFPGPYLYKVIGPNTADFVTKVIQAVINVVGPNASPAVETRESAQGNHLSVSLTIEMQNAEQVLDVYDVLRGIHEVRYVF